MTGERLVVLSDLAELKDQIDVPRAERAKAEAEDALSRDPDDAEAAAALRRADTRIEVAS
jgi:F-type H+-transporting ATPase subunit epsilon